MTTETIKLCRNSVCRREIFDGDESTEDPDYCSGCGDLMPAFCSQPDWNQIHRPLIERAAGYEEWNQIATDSLYGGGETTGGQCGNCGNDTWVVHEDRYHGYVVKCETPEGDEPDPDIEPCGAEYVVEYLPGRVVVWL